METKMSVSVTRGKDGYFEVNTSYDCPPEQCYENVCLMVADIYRTIRRNDANGADTFVKTIKRMLSTPDKLDALLAKYETAVQKAQTTVAEEELERGES